MWIPDRYRFRDERAAEDSWLPFDDIYEHTGGSLHRAPPRYNLPGLFIDLKSVTTGQYVGRVYLPFLVLIPQESADEKTIVDQGAD